MKKRFTLMMMVLCFLMSIPLKMMAETVTVHFIDNNGWTKYAAYVYDCTKTTVGSEWVTEKWPGQEAVATDITYVNNNKVVTWTIELGSCSLANARIIFNNGSGGQGNQYPGPNNGGFEVANNQYYNNIGKTDAPSAGGGSTGGGSGSETTHPTITVKSQYNQEKWDDNNNFHFLTTDGKIYTCTLDNVPSGTEAIWFRIVRDGKEYGPQSTKEDLLLTDTYQPIYENGDKALKIVPTPGKTSYTITYDYENNQIKYDASESGGSTGSGSTTDDTWAETENRLKGRVYTKGYYLAGNFFSFSGAKVTYDDAVFKFQRQKNDDEGNAVYMVEIPASLTAHAQVMRVIEFGKAVKVYGPIKAYGISYTCPKTDMTTDQLDLIGSENLDEGTYYWNITTRNENENEYSDGIYEVFITIDKNTHEPSKWLFKHTPTKRVAYFISDAKNATALPVYDSRKGVADGFSNRFYGTVSFSADHSYYVIANYVQDKYHEQLINYTKDKYKTCKPGVEIVPTTNKLFLLGNGGLDFKDASPNNEFSPNEDPMKPGSYAGSFVAEFNPSNGVWEQTDTKKHLGIRGQVQKRIKGEIITSISMVGDAIPGTLKVDETTGKEVWDYASTAADMTYDETDKCYKTTIITTVEDNGKSKFRFVGNHKQKINWHEDTKDDAKMKAKTPYTGGGDGHAATSYDPNKISYTSENANPEEDYNIIWNRPAGRWTVRLFFYTYNVDGNDVTDYYYTITENKELELRDFNDVVYKSLDNKRNIRLRGDYKYFRTWSSAKAWKISNDVDIFVVNAMNTNEADGTVSFSLQKISADETGKDNVIPSNTGVILATKKTAETIKGGAEVRERASLTTYNTLVIPIEEYNASAETADYKGTNLLKPLITSQVVPTVEHKAEGDVYNYLFGFGNANYVGISGYQPNDFLLGFWISNGKLAFFSNSCYLPVTKETADKLKLGVKYDDFDTSSGAKKIPALFFDFANVGSTTGINEVVNQSTKLNDGKYYTLSGQQVEKPTAGGIYIHNGRKFVVK